MSSLRSEQSISTQSISTRPISTRPTSTQSHLYTVSSLRVPSVHSPTSNPCPRSGLIASYTTEILPYNLRAKGFVIMEWALYGALFFNQYVNPIAMKHLEWKYYIFYCVFLAFEVVIVYFFYVETRYLPLEEVTKIFDGEDVAQLTLESLESTDKAVTTSVHVEETGEVVDKV